jgi:hypothetical protein
MNPLWKLTEVPDFVALKPTPPQHGHLAIFDGSNRELLKIFIELQYTLSLKMYHIAIKEVNGRLWMVPLQRWDETVLPSLARKVLSLGQRGSLLVYPTCCQACVLVGYASQGQGR